MLTDAQVLLDMYNQHKVYLGEKQRALVVATYLNQQFPYDPGDPVASNAANAQNS